MFPGRSLSFAGDGGGAGGSGDGGAEGDGAGEKKYTEEEFKKRLEESLETSMKRWRKNLQKDLESATKEKEELLAKLKDVEEQMQKAQQSKGDDTVEGRIELLKKEHERKYATLQEQLNKETDARKIAEQRAKETRRDTLLQGALAQAGCRDLRVGYRLLLPEVELDPEEEDVWKIRTPGGNLVEINAETMQELLPDYLKTPATVGAGSGSQSGTVRREQRRADLEEKEKRLEQMRATARRDDEIAAYQRLKSEIRKLRAELEQAKTK
jgi:hypothetical protein